MADPYEAGLPSLLIQAAQSAAQADGLPAPPVNNDEDTSALDFAKALHPGAGLNSASALRDLAKKQGMQRAGIGGLPSAVSNGMSGKKKGPPLRRGKWTPEEEAYANRLIQEFKAGLLPLTDGTTLRTFLSKLLNCDPMRISKKFVGSNCIGKQVFRRRTADINRLTPEQIQQSRAELSELERRFLERVAQTNRVKSSGVGGGAAAATASIPTSIGGKMKEESTNASPPSPPWLQPPLGYKQGSGAAMAAANLSGGETNSRAAAAGRALLQGLNAGSLKSALERKSSSSALASHESAGLLAMAELQRRASQSSLLQSRLRQSSASNLLAAAAAAKNGSSSALAQMARNASAARLAGLGAGSSMNSLMMKTGLSRDQLSQLARDRGLSSASLSNMMERQNSFDALMSLDFQSLQSIDNLANLIQTGNGAQAQSGGNKNWSKNWSADNAQSNSRSGESSGSLSNAARRLASAGRIESLLRSLSGNVGSNSSNNLNLNSVREDHNGGGGGSNGGGGGNDVRESGSNANLSNLLLSMQNNLGGINSNNANSFLGSGSASAVSLANLLRPDSSTGLTALRMQEGLNQRNSSVEDFLSLVAAGDIPHQDPGLLDIPLMQQQGGGSGSDSQAAAALLAQRQLLAQAASSRSLAGLAGGASSGNLNRTSSAAALLAQARDRSASSSGLKRKLLELEGSLERQGLQKR